MADWALLHNFHSLGRRKFPLQRSHLPDTLPRLRQSLRWRLPGKGKAEIVWQEAMAKSSGLSVAEWKGRSPEPGQSGDGGRSDAHLAVGRFRARRPPI